MLDWREYDTILLDMDGTVLDLSFDNYFWRELVPRCLARSLARDQARVCTELFSRYARKQGSLEWYCLDYWTAELGLDLKSLKSASSHRIRFLPGARDFLQAAVADDKQMFLVTNAHGYTLEVKKQVAGLARYVQTMISAHEFGFAKEEPEFWPALARRLGFDPAHTLLLDDSLPVLDAASDFGIRTCVAISRPDSRQGEQSFPGYPRVTGIAALLAG
jgi:putative hydrolase of the HAD superfamily